MKETHIFYTPEIAKGVYELPHDEAGHAIRVLRMKENDELTLTDGLGKFYQARITLASSKHCMFEIESSLDDAKLWKGNLHLAVAPTKNIDRIEWLVEKITEIGIDQISLLDCQNSERHIVKTDRLEKIVISAMKQSHKAYKPIINSMTSFQNFIHQELPQERFIAHCYSPEDIVMDYPTVDTPKSSKDIHISNENFLGDLLNNSTDCLVLIGPEGDFSIDEVKSALEAGFRPISLGRSRLRTETAALVAVHLMNLAKRN